MPPLHQSIPIVPGEKYKNKIKTEAQICLFKIFFIIIYPIQFFSLRYSMVTQLHVHVYILFSPIILLHHKWLHIVLSATQQDLIANPFQKQ